MNPRLFSFFIFLGLYSFSFTAQEHGEFLPIQNQMNNQNTRIRRQYGQSISPLNLASDLIDNQNLPARHCVTPDQILYLDNRPRSHRGGVTPENVVMPETIVTPGRIRRQFALPRNQPTGLFVELPSFLPVTRQISSASVQPRRLEFN